MKKKLQIIGIIFTMLLAVTIGGCSCSEDAKDAVNATSIEIVNKKTIDCHIGETFKLTYKLGPSNVTRNEVQVTSSTEGIVSLSNTLFENYIGYRDTVTVTALAEGETIITFTTVHGELSSAIKINVTDPKAIDNVTGIAFAEGKLTWNAVEHASKYEVCIYKATDDDTATPVSREYSETQEYIVPDSLQKGVEYVATVQAIGQGENSKYLDGVVSPKTANFYIMEDIEEVSKNQYVVSWGEIAHASSYDIKVLYKVLGNADYTEFNGNTTNTSYDLSQLSTNVVDYKVFVRPIKEENEEIYIFDSAVFADNYQTTITKLGVANNIKISNSTLDYSSSIVWDAVAGATSYDITIDGVKYDASTNAYDITDKGYTAGSTHNVSIIAKADGLVTGESVAYTFTVMPNASLVNIENGILSFTGVSGQKVSNYVVYFENTDNETSMVKVNTLSTSVDLSVLSEGTYKIYIRTLTSNENIVGGVKWDTGKTITVLGNATITSVTNGNLVGENNVTTIANDSAMITWASVTNASSYEIWTSKNGGTLTLLATSGSTTYDLSQLSSPLGAGSYELVIRAVGNGSQYLSSGTSGAKFSFVKLETISKDSITYNSESNIVSWATVLGTDEYLVYDGTNTYNVQENKFTPKNFVVGQNQIQIIAMGNGTSSINSTISQVFTYTKLVAPTDLSINNGKLEFSTSITGSVTYLLSIDDSDTLIDITSYVTMTGTSGVADISSVITTVGEHSLRLKARVSGSMDSDLSEEVLATKLEIVNDFKVSTDGTNETFSFTLNEATSYEITTIFNNGSTTENVTIYGDGVEFTSSALSAVAVNGVVTINLKSGLLSGSYAVTIRAIGDEYITSDLSETYTFYKLSSPTISIENGKVVWTESKVGEITASSYLVSIDDGKFSEIVGTTYVDYLSAGDHTIRVKAITTESDTLYADMVSYDFTKNALVENLRVENGVITWDLLSGDYTYHIYNGETKLLDTKSNNASTATYVVSEYMNIYVYATLTDNVDGDKNATALVVAKLPTVKDLTTSKVGEDIVLTFGQVSLSENGTLKEVATKYLVYEVVDGSIGEPKATIVANGSATYTYTIPYTLGGTYAYVVYAVGSESESTLGYLDSDESLSKSLTILDSVDSETFSVVNGELIWDAVVTDSKTPRSYSLSIFKVDENGTYDYLDKKYTLITNISLDKDTLSYDFSDYVGGTYLVHITCMGDNTEVFDSVVSGDYEVTKIAVSTLAVQNGVIVWSAPSNVEDVTYYLNVGNDVVEIGGEYNSYIDSELSANNLLTYSIFAKKEGYIYSDLSNVITADRLSNVENFSLIYDSSVDPSVITLTWHEVKNAESYLITVTYGENEPVTIPVTTNSLEYPLINESDSATTIKVTIVAVGGNAWLATQTGYITSAVSQELSINTLDQVSGLSLKNGIITWNAVSNATSYLVEVTDSNDAVVLKKFTSENSYNFEAISSSTYTISVTARGVQEGNNIYIHSNTPAVLTGVKKDDALSNVAIENGLIVWELSSAEVTALYEDIDLGDSTALESLANLVNKIKNKQELTEDEQTVYDRAEHLLYIEVAYQSKSNAEEVKDDYQFETDIFVSKAVAEGSVVKLYYDFDKPSGYYDIKIRARGNSGDMDSTYTLYLDGVYSGVINAYKSIAPKQASIIADNEAYFVYGNKIYWNRVYYTDVYGSDRESRYVIEVNFTHGGVVTHYEFFVDTDSDYITSADSEYGNGYGVVPFGDIVNKFALQSGEIYNVTVRVVGGTSDISNTVALRSAYETYSQISYIKSNTPLVTDGEISWEVSSAGAEYIIVRFYDNNNVLLSDDTLRGIIKEQYGALLLDEETGEVLSAKVDSYLINHGIKMSPDTTFIITELLASDKTYKVSVQEIGNGSSTIDSDESGKCSFVALANNINDIAVNDGKFVWTNDDASRVKIYSTIDGEIFNEELSSQKIVVRKISNDGGSQVTYELPDTLPYADSDGNVIYYTIAVASHPTENNLTGAITSNFVRLSTTHRRLETPTYSTTTGTYVYWTKVANALGYNVSINLNGLDSLVQEDTSGDQVYVDLDDVYDNGVNIYPAGTYTFKVRATHPSSVSGENNLLISNYFTETITKLKKATIRIENGEIKWSIADMGGVEADNVEVKIYEGSDIFDTNGNVTATPIFTKSDFENTVQGINIYDYIEANAETKYTISVKLLTNSKTGISGETSYMSFTTLDTPVVVWSKIDNADPTLEEPALKWASVDHASGYRITATAGQTAKYVIDYDVVSGVVTGVTYTHYTYEDGIWLVNKSNIPFNIDALVVSEGNLLFLTNSLASIISQEITTYEIYVEAMGSDSTDSEYYTMSEPSESLYKVIPMAPTSVTANSDTGIVSWTNTTSQTTPTIRLIYRLTINDSNNTVANILSRLAGNNYEIEYDTGSADTATTATITLIERLDKNATSYTLSQIAYYTSISVLSESDDYTKSDYSTATTVGFSAFADGNGTISNPYIINNYNHLDHIRYFTTADKYFKVEQVTNGDDNIVISNSYVTISAFSGNIDFGSDTMTIINDSGRQLFTTLNGEISNINMTVNVNSTRSSWNSLIAETNNGTISNVDISISASLRTATDYYSISTSRFVTMVVTNNGSIANANITLDNVKVNLSGSLSSNNYVSLVAYNNTSTIDGVTLSGEINISTGSYMAYVSAVHFISSVATVSNVSNKLDMSIVSNSNLITTYMAGIAYRNDGTIKRSSFEGSMSGSEANIAGIVLQNYGKVQECFNTGSISLTSLKSTNNSVIGGLVGTMWLNDSVNTYSPTIVDSYVALKKLSIVASNSATIRFGGLVGSVQNDTLMATISGSYVLVDTVTLGSNILSQTNCYLGMIVGQQNGTNLSLVNVYYDTNTTITGLVGQGNTVSGATAITLKSSAGAIADNLNTLKNGLSQTAFALGASATLSEGYSVSYSYFRLSYQSN